MGLRRRHRVRLAPGRRPRVDVAITHASLRGEIATSGTALRELTAFTAAGSLSVAALSLVAERAGLQLLGFPLAVHGLTVAHFHFAGFVAALLGG